MKSKNLLLIMLSVLLLYATACTETFTKESYIRDYDAWLIRLKQDYKNFNEEDWLRSATEFKKYSEVQYERFKNDFSTEETQRLDNLAGQYYAILAKHKVSLLKDELKSVVNKAKGMLEELQKE